MCMGSDSFTFFPKTTPKGSSTKEILLKEIQKAKEKLSSIPQPYCELDCPWLGFCRRISSLSCILSEIIDSSSWQGFTNDSC